MIEYKRLAKERKKKKILVAAGIILAAICLLAGVFFLCTVKTVEVVGNKNYSKKEIEEMVLPTGWDHNTICLLYKTHTHQVETPPFLDMVEIEVLSYNKIRIHAYEKTIMGYVPFNGSYVYFDKDGILLKTSQEPEEGYPMVEGLQFDHIIMFEKLPVKDEEVFKTMVSLIQMLSKNSLNPDHIEFTQDDEIDITFGEVLVHLGKDSHMDNKIARLTGILPKLEGRSGILFMEDVDETTDRIVFRKTKSKAQLAEEAENPQTPEENGGGEDDSWEDVGGDEDGSWDDSGDDSGSEDGNWDDSGDGSGSEDGGGDGSEDGSWDDSGDGSGSEDDSGDGSEDGSWDDSGEDVGGDGSGSEDGGGDGSGEDGSWEDGAE